MWTHTHFANGNRDVTADWYDQQTKESQSSLWRRPEIKERAGSPVAAVTCTTTLKSQCQERKQVGRLQSEMNAEFFSLTAPEVSKATLSNMTF